MSGERKEGGKDNKKIVKIAQGFATILIVSCPEAFYFWLLLIR